MLMMIIWEREICARYNRGRYNQCHYNRGRYNRGR